MGTSPESAFLGIGDFRLGNRGRLGVGRVFPRRGASSPEKRARNERPEGIPGSITNARGCRGTVQEGFLKVSTPPPAVFDRRWPVFIRLFFPRKSN